MSSLQHLLELVGITALSEKAIRVVPVRQLHAPRRHPLRPEAPRHALRRVLATAVGGGIESQIDGPHTVTQLLKLARVEMGTQRAGDLVESCLP